MHATSRTIFAGLLGAALAFAAGCGSKPPPPEPDVPVNPDPTPAPGTNTPQAKAAHEMDPAKHAIPASPIRWWAGETAMIPVAVIEGDQLYFRVVQPDASMPDRSVALKLRTSDAQAFENRTLSVKPETPPGPDVPEVLLKVPQQSIRLYTNAYALTLELGVRANGKIPGKIYLCMPDEEKSVLAGTFEAEYARQPTDPPGVEDVPLVNGSVSVRGAPTEALLMVGYAAHPTPEQFPLGAAEIQLGEPVVPARWAQISHDKPRETFVIAGDGKNVASRYEHSKLAPGRYFVFASLKNGPAAWKWVAVGEKGTVAADLTIDATQIGGVEVVVPLEALGKVQLAPADEAARTPMDGNLFVGIALQLRLEQDIVARKALFKNLAPGRYEVRAGGQIRIAEIVAGKTIELDFDKKPAPPKPEPAPDPKPKE